MSSTDPAHELLESTRGHITIRLAGGQIVRFNGEWHLPVPGSPGFVLYRCDVVDPSTNTALSGDALEAALLAFQEFATARNWPFEIV